MPMFQSLKYYFLQVTFLYWVFLLMMSVLRISFCIMTLIFRSHMLIRADAPVMGTLWEFIMAADNEIG